MVRASCLLMVVLLATAEPVKGAAGDLGANAALQYWQAFSTMPKFADAEQSKLSADCLTMPLDARAREVVSTSAYALRLVHLGAALPRCEWGIDWDELGIEALLPQLSAARLLASIACVRARVRFGDGQSQAAVDDLMDALTLARQLSWDGSLLSILVGYAIEGRIDELLASELPNLDADMIRRVQKRLAALPVGGTPAVAVRMAEERSLGWMSRKVRQTTDRQSLLKFLSFAFVEEGAKGDTLAKTRAFVEKCGGTAEAIAKYCDAARGAYELMATKLALPPAVFADEFARVQAQYAGNPVFQLAFPALGKLRFSQLRADERRALLGAALAVQLEGKGALANHPDPVSGGLFDYEAFPGGYELRSTFVPSAHLRQLWKLDERAAKPITLTIGKRTK